jgi:hypothetical protein
MLQDIMSPKIRKLVVIVGTTALFGGVAAGCGSTSTTNATAASGTAQQQGSSAGRPAGPSAADLSTLASKLGVSTTKLQAAMQTARSTTGGRPADMAATIAKELGLSTAKVQAALQAVRPAGGPRTPPQAGAAASSSPTTSS